MEDTLSVQEAARAASKRPLEEVAAGMGLTPDLLEPYGRHVAKVRLDEALTALADRPKAKYVLVTAVTPTPLGEGKTTTTIGLGQAMQHLGKRATVSIRQPSMGPTFGIKGGGAGGGFSQVVPMELPNLHLTGDAHAVTAAHNLLAAMVDNKILRNNNGVRLDPETVAWRRVLDVNDRSLRSLVSGLGERSDGPLRQTGFEITAASEVMAVLALADSLQDLRDRLGRIVVGKDVEGEPVTAERLRAAGAMTAILREAIKPNLMQTIENTPVLVHTGPFGNIAHGNSSIVADRVGIRAGDYLITEAGFGADMGAERFFNIKCRVSGLEPDAAVVVTTVRALKAHSGRHRIEAGRPLPDALLREHPDDVYQGSSNLRKQVLNVLLHGVSPVVAVNAFPTDHESEYEAIREVGRQLDVPVVVCNHYAEGGRGAVELAEAVDEAASRPSGLRFLYDDDLPLSEKVETIAKGIYGARGVEYDRAAWRKLRAFERRGLGRLPVCIAKTHLSLSADPALKGAPVDWTLPVRDVRASVGAGFIYLICGDIRTMPGLSSEPAAESIDIDENGEIVGLF